MMSGDEVAQRNNSDKQRMDCAELDARPFLHYLQYLTYGGLGDRDNQQHELTALEFYMHDPRNNIKRNHDETAVNMLGHCYEMEGQYAIAYFYYQVSLRLRSTNNAANWHVRRLQRLTRC
ncbi:hypothetical protein DPMN_126478 [Dreissena polymorpha]|uniref:Uncharacterized protein n=1 Tax=Dreissena polymorpha TaxID=45954 RepID=A0A9D4GVT5_DREPO|nr:hypothetical protein DPMN_126478 [Dreissena polymorpha]